MTFLVTSESPTTTASVAGRFTVGADRPKAAEAERAKRGARRPTAWHSGPSQASADPAAADDGVAKGDRGGDDQGLVPLNSAPFLTQSLAQDVLDAGEAVSSVGALAREVAIRFYGFVRDALAGRRGRNDSGIIILGDRFPEGIDLEA
ncbi:hypothetical protein [Rhodospirillum rubrum]|uniref:hypothetical protein n=1 Tax=Rhodospirillum rubrum TaxID=1085 RepID=UPI00031F8203|nr:hypothetical protein [Rhodospirillum rubrum]